MPDHIRYGHILNIDPDANPAAFFCTRTRAYRSQSDAIQDGGPDIGDHTDTPPISTARFPSNWELSSARAVAVVKFLIDQGIPPNRLVAAGFGEYQPLEPGTSEPTYRRNRRIEFKLTER
jgi:flagellar motor protein MotB